jgi:hypothetical protein
VFTQSRHISYRESSSIVACGHYLATAVSLPPQFLLWANMPQYLVRYANIIFMIAIVWCILVTMLWDFPLFSFWLICRHFDYRYFVKQTLNINDNGWDQTKYLSNNSTQVTRPLFRLRSVSVYSNVLSSTPVGHRNEKSLSHLKTGAEIDPETSSVSILPHKMRTLQQNFSKINHYHKP